LQTSRAQFFYKSDLKKEQRLQEVLLPLLGGILIMREQGLKQESLHIFSSTAKSLNFEGGIKDLSLHCAVGVEVLSCACAFACARRRQGSSGPLYFWHSSSFFLLAISYCANFPARGASLHGESGTITLAPSSARSRRRPRRGSLHSWRHRSRN